MRQGIKKLQSRKVDEILNLYFSDQYEITFKSPTGSGKTYMMADLMNRIVDSNTIFLVSSLSKGGLADQNHDKFLEYSRSDFVKINPFLINSYTSAEEKLFIPVDYNVYSLPRDLYKKNSKLMEGAMISFIQEIHSAGKKIVLIRDECHQATNNLDKLNEFFYKVINMSATPQTTRFHIDVELTEEEAVSEKLIKTNQNPIDYNHYTLDEQLIQLEEEVLPLFVKVKQEYNNKLKMNPALIIQISNKDKGNTEWNRIKKILNNSKYALKWMYIVEEGSKENDTNDHVKKLPMSKWREYAKNNEGLIDVIVFKMVITEGWDIPRACMLYQIRDTNSATLDEQVYGRIRRNPILTRWSQYDRESQELALKCWVWGYMTKNNKQFKKVKIKPNNNFIIQTTRLNNLKNNPDFDLIKFIEEKRSRKKISTENIFSLYKKWNNITEQTSLLVWDYIKNYKDWFEISENLNEINEKNNEYLSSYDKSMILGDLVSLSDESYYETTNSYVEINEWAWENYSEENKEFHFDSDAEKEFARILRDFGLETFGKNYYPNSEIYFEYFDVIVKRSYPDFVLKDKSGQVHIFEVKSFNKSSSRFIDKDEYNDKVVKILECYKHASKLTDNIFYIPIKVGSNWIIEKVSNGIVDRIVLEQLKNFIDY